MVRERQEKGSQPLSRFFTTAMLPKLTLINKRRRVILIVATNHVEAFDSAILRRGRFDLVIQVMPPSTPEKLRKWAKVRENLEQCHVNLTETVSAQLAALTYAEFEEHAKSFSLPGDTQQVLQRIADAHAKCTLNSPIASDDATLWSEVCEEQAIRYIRLRNVDNAENELLP
jgi:SpoVK/Ycf46/Vps4 family AAA+-type ATPase